MMRLAWFFVFFLSATSIVHAQSCRIAPDLPNPRLLKVEDANPTANFDSYTLALSWSPQFCSDANQARRSANAHQCQDNVFGWVVHGLWPQNSRAQSIADHPRFCPARSLYVPRETVQRYVCLLPGAQLIQAQWQKHGSCAFADSEQYFSQTARLYAQLRLPDPEVLARTARPLSVGALRLALVQANPGLTARDIFISLDNRKRLREVRLCYDKAFKFAACTRLGAPDWIALGVTLRAR
jgi:ribonuclease T2